MVADLGVLGHPQLSLPLPVAPPNPRGDGSLHPIPDPTLGTPCELLWGLGPPQIVVLGVGPCSGVLGGAGE